MTEQTPPEVDIEALQSAFNKMWEGGFKYTGEHESAHQAMRDHALGVCIGVSFLSKKPFKKTRKLLIKVGYTRQEVDEVFSQIIKSVEPMQA